MPKWPRSVSESEIIIIYLVFGAVSVVSLKDEPEGSNDDVSEASVMLEETQTEKQYKYKQVFFYFLP